jgi:hypothetical protein
MSEDLPVWFSVLMVALALPCAWLGGKLKNGG